MRKEITDIMGRFYLKSQSKNLLSIEFVGTLKAESITPAQIEYIKGFYGAEKHIMGVNGMVLTK